MKRAMQQPVIKSDAPKGSRCRSLAPKPTDVSQLALDYSILAGLHQRAATDSGYVVAQQSQRETYNSVNRFSPNAHITYAFMATHTYSTLIC